MAYRGKKQSPDEAMANLEFETSDGVEVRNEAFVRTSLAKRKRYNRQIHNDTFYMCRAINMLPEI